jgi:hypothetical protein
VALDSLQPIGDLCDLLGVSRRRPGVFHAMVDLLYEGEGGSADAERDARIHARAMRFMGRG